MEDTSVKPGLAVVVHEIEPFANMMIAGMDNTNKPYHMPLHSVGCILLAALYWQALCEKKSHTYAPVEWMPRLSTGPSIMLAAGMDKCFFEDK